MKSFESIGVWFLPSDPDNQIGGKIKYSVEKGLRLSLSGSFQKRWSFESADYPVIHGVVSESPYGKFFTLFRCFATHTSFGMPGVSVETIRANFGYAGPEMLESESVRFAGVSLRFSPLQAWLNRSGFSVNHRPAGFDVSWNPPVQERCALSDAMLTTALGASIQGGPHANRISLEELPTITVGEFGLLTQEQIHARFVWPVVALMTFAADGTPEFQRYQLTLESGGKSLPSQFDRLFAPSVKPVNPQPTRAYDMLFTCADLKEGFDEFVRKWFLFVNKHPRFCSLFFQQGYERRGFLERRLASLMRASERLLADELVDSPEALRPFADVLDPVLEREPFAKAPYSRYALPSATQVAARNQFAAVLNEHWRLIDGIVGTSLETFLLAVYETYATIEDRFEPAPAAVSGTQMYWLLARLAAVLKIIVMARLGFADAAIEEIVGRNAQMAHLKNVKDPWVGKK